MYRLNYKILIVLIYLFSLSLSAHESRPLYIKITQLKSNIYKMQIKVPPTVDSTNHPIAKLPNDCIGLQGSNSQLFKCNNSIAGNTVKITYPKFSPAVSTLISYEAYSGEKHTAVLAPGQKTWLIPLNETINSVAKQYVKMGIQHILKGWDHLLFLLCLVIIAVTGKRILITITGFTIAHSITLGLSSMQLVRVPILPVEAVIALSVVFLATEIARNRQDSITWKHPIAVSSSFGLLHGFGFAAVLGEIGLPQTELFAGLLFFNIGVELGQLAFVLALIIIIKTLFACHIDIYKPKTKNILAYSVGALSSSWMIERIVGFWF